MAEGWIEQEGDGDRLVLRAGGAWCLAGAAALDRKLDHLRLPPSRAALIDLGEVESLDTVGAWLVVRLERALADRGTIVSIEHLAHDLEPLLQQVARGKEPPPPRPRRRPTPTDDLVTLGRKTVEFGLNVGAHLGFLGHVVLVSGRTVLHPSRLRVTAIIAQMERVGVSSWPIVGLLSFLVGVVTAWQGADQLRYYGAEIMTVNLLGLGFLRELGALLAAIIVAGRSGSAFTAEIGAMEVNEEVDALRTLGLDPIELLVLPRLIALMLTLPLVTFWANCAGLAGGALLCWVLLSIPLPVFAEQLHSAISMWSFWLGIIKAPFFAGAIAMVGCREGMSVERNAASVGRRTTQSVVQSIFLVIVIDAAFSILFSSLGI